MAVESHVEEHWPHVVALAALLDALDGREANITGFNIPALVEALKAHEQRGGRVPWK